MISSKHSRRRRSHGKPPICIHAPEVPYPYEIGPPGTATEPYPAPLIRFHQSLTQTPPPDPPFPIPHTRNLIYHLYAPTTNDAWRQTTRHIIQHQELFNGRIIVAIAQDQTTHNTQQLIRQFEFPAQVFTTQNDPRTREANTFTRLLHQVKNYDPHQATLYMHSKGSTQTHHDRPDEAKAIELWVAHMLATLITNYYDYEHLWQTHATIGTYKIDYTRRLKIQPLSPTGIKWPPWHYSGAFFWFSHEQTFRRPRWSSVLDDPFAAEMWPGNTFPTELAGSIPPSWTLPRQKPQSLYALQTHLSPTK